MANDISLFNAYNAVATFNSLPGVQFQVQQFVIPSSAIGISETRHNFGTPIQVPGTTFNTQPLQFSWILEESMESYFEVYNWLITLVNPSELNSETITSDCSILIYNNNNRLIKTINFSDAFPEALSEISLDTTQERDEPVIVNATFNFDVMSMKAHN